jgi:outer membrane lipoprotein carrier protein
MTKEFPSTNAQIADDRANVENHFVIRASSFFRHYGLVIRHSAERQHTMSGSSAVQRRMSSAGFQTCCVADFQVGMINGCRAVSGFGNPRYSRLGSLRYFACTIAFLYLAAMVAHADERDVQFDRWFAAQTNLQSWSADFTQTRSLKVLSQPLVATGKVWVTVPNQFRWELGQPAQTIVLRQPDQLLIIYPRLKRAEKYSLEGVPPGPLKDALALMDASLPRDRATMEERFRLLSATETNSILQMTLQPKSASARKFIGEILIGFHTNDFSIAVTELKFADGSSLRNDFTNTVLNRPIDPALFQVKLAPDFTVVEPLRQ